MFLKKNLKNLRSLFTICAALGIATMMLWWGANTFTASASTKLHDFTGNGTTDFTTLQFTTGGPITWKTLGNPANPAPNQAFIRRFDYGSSDTDSVVPEDYTGDAKTEVAVWRDFGATAPGTAGVYYVSQFPTGPGGIILERAVRWGDAFTDVPSAVGDYDGDGKADYTVVRVISSTLNFFIMSSSTGTMRQIPFGAFRTVGGQGATGVFPGADFNGDGRDELIVISFNAAGVDLIEVGDAVTGAGVITRNFGNFNTDTALPPRDYTGDGKADFVAVRESTTPATWYINNSATNTSTGTAFGISDPAFMDFDLPVRGDFDGDNIQDICVWRESNTTFYYKSSLNGSIQSQKFGDVGDVPLGSLVGF